MELDDTIPRDNTVIIIIFIIFSTFNTDGSFRKLGVPYFGVLISRIILFGVLY